MTIVVALAIVALALLTGCLADKSDTSAESSSSSSPANAPAASASNAPASESPTTLADLLDTQDISSIELIGDSITAGYGTDGYVTPDATTGTQAICTAAGTTYYETPATVRCWANDFRAYAADHGATGFVNRGICGWTMHDLATYAPDYVTDADLIVCMLGTNDTVNHSLETFRDDSATALAYLSAHCRVLIVMIPPVTDWTQSGYYAYFTPQDTAEVLTDICSEAGYPLVSNMDVIQLDTDLVNADNVHPTTKGSDAIWSNLLSASIEAL